MKHLLSQFATTYSNNLHHEFIQLDGREYFGQNSPVMRMDRHRASVPAMVENNEREQIRTTYFIYFTHEYDYRGEKLTDDVVLAFRFLNAEKREDGEWELIQSDEDCELWLKTLSFEGDYVYPSSVSKPAPAPTLQPTPAPTPTPKPAGASALGKGILATAESQLGKSYKLGAGGPDSFDSAGLIHYCLNANGLGLKRCSLSGYSTMGEIIGFEDIMEGDVLFFRTDSDSVPQHAGIYAGDGEMIDASSSYGKVVKKRLGDYYRRNFIQAVRFDAVLNSNMKRESLTASTPMLQPTPMPTSTPTVTGASIAAAAKAQIGKPYERQYRGPDKFGPAGLVYFALNSAGVDVDWEGRCDKYADLEGYERIEDMDELREGDVMFFQSGGEDSHIVHAGIYVGYGQIVDASGANDMVVQRNVHVDLFETSFSHALRFA